MKSRQKCTRCGSLGDIEPGQELCASCLLLREQSDVGGRSPDRWEHAEDSEEPKDGDVQDGYKLLEEIGRGGMGVVYRARSTDTGGLVALKRIRGGASVRRSDLRRFLKEAELLSRLRHPGIVGVHEVVEHPSRPYFTMEWVEGRSVREVLRDGPMAPEAAAKRMSEVAASVQYLHEQGVLHRDLTPANLMEDGAGRIRILDFGLAGLIGEASMPGGPDVIAGSPSYMSPEQAGAGEGEITVRSDVYSLGAILYEMLTGRAPFRAADPTDTLRMLATKEPLAPKLVNPALPMELDAICQKCLSRRPSERYATAGELGQDLDCFLEKKPIAARPVSKWRRWVRWVRREPGTARIVVGAIAVLLVGSVGSVLWARSEARARAVAQVRDGELRESLAASRARITRFHVLSGSRLQAENRALEGLPSFLEAWKLESADPSREAVHRRRISTIWQDVPKLEGYWLEASGIRRVSFESSGEISAETELRGRTVLSKEAALPVHPIGRLVHAPSRWRVEKVDDATLALVRRESGEVVHPSLRHRGDVEFLTLSPDDQVMVALVNKKEIQVWNTATGSRAGAAIPLNAEYREVRFSGDSQRFLLRTLEEVRVFQATPLRWLSSARNPFLSAADLDAPGERMLTGGSDGSVQLWRLPPRREASPVWSGEGLVCQGDRRIAVSRDDEGKWWFRHLLTDEVISGPLPDAADWTHADWNPIHSEWLAQKRDGSVWTGSTSGPPVRIAIAPHGTGRRWRWHGEGNGWIASSTQSPDVSIYSRATPRSPTHQFTLDSMVSEVATEQAGPGVAWGGVGGLVHYWAGGTPPPKRLGVRHQGVVTCLAITPSGQRLASGGEDGWVRVWSPREDHAVGPGIFHGRPVAGLALSADGLRVAVWDRQGLRIWRVMDGRPLTSPIWSAIPPTAAEFSPDTQEVVTGALGDRPQLWDASNGEWLGAAPALANAWQYPFPLKRATPPGGFNLLWLKQLPALPPTLGEVGHQCRLMSGLDLDESGRLSPAPAKELLQMWEILRPGSKNRIEDRQ